MTRMRGLLMIVVPLLVACGGGGAYMLHRGACQRRAEAALADGRQRRADGRIEDAIAAYGGYFTWTGGRRRDARVLAEYADLLAARAAAGGDRPRDVIAAHTALENAVRANPDDPALRTKLVEHLIKLRRFTDAREQLRTLQAGAREPVQPGADPFSLALLNAKAYAGSGQDREAAEEAAKIIGFDLDSRTFTSETPARPAGAGGRTSEAYLLLAGLLRNKLKDARSADAVLERCVAANPEDATAWLDYAQRKATLDDVAAATAAASQVTRLDPGTTKAAMADFLILNLRGQSAAATAAIAQALERFPDDLPIRVAAVRHAIKQQEGGRALEFIAAGLERFGHRPVLVNLIADVPVAPGDVGAVEEALDTLRAMLGPAELRPGIVEARVCMARRRWFEARRLLAAARPAVAADPRHKSRVDRELARCHRELGEYDEQLAASSRALGENTASLEARLLLVQALLSLGQTERAVAELLHIERLAAAPGPATTAAGSGEPTASRRLDSWLAVLDAGSHEADMLERVERLLAAVCRSPLTTPDDRLIATAEVLSRTGDARRAIAMLDEALATEPSRASLQAALARLTLDHEGPAAAAATVDRAPAGVRKDPHFLLVAARIGAAQDDPATAAARLANVEEAALSLPDPPDAASVLRNLAALAGAGERRGEEKRLWRLAIERLPRDLRGHLALAEIAADEMDEAGARAAADEIGRLAGEKSPEWRYAGAVACMIAGGGRVIGASAPALQPGQRRVPRNPERLREARNLLVEAEGERRGWMPIQKLFAAIELREGDRAAAIARLEKARQLAPGDASVGRMLDAVRSQSDRGGG